MELIADHSGHPETDLPVRGGRVSLAIIEFSAYANATIALVQLSSMVWLVGHVLWAVTAHAGRIRKLAVASVVAYGGVPLLAGLMALQLVPTQGVDHIVPHIVLALIGLGGVLFSASTAPTPEHQDRYSGIAPWTTPHGRLAGATGIVVVMGVGLTLTWGGLVGAQFLQAPFVVGFAAWMVLYGLAARAARMRSRPPVLGLPVGAGPDELAGDGSDPSAVARDGSTSGGGASR